MSVRAPRVDLICGLWRDLVPLARRVEDYFRVPTDHHVGELLDRSPTVSDRSSIDFVLTIWIFLDTGIYPLTGEATKRVTQGCVHDLGDMLRKDVEPATISEFTIWLSF